MSIWRLRDAQIARGLDALDIDAGQRLPEGARGIGADEMLRLAVEGDDRDLRRAGLHDLEIALGDVGLELGEKQRALGRKLGAHDLHDLGREPAEGIDLGEAARMKQALEAAVAHQEGALVVLDDNRGPQAGPVHHTTPYSRLLRSRRRHEPQTRSPAARPRR